MRKFIVCAALALSLAASVGTASAKVKSRKLTFGSDFWVGDALVKSGTYKVAYDDKTGEVTISDKETTLAKTTVRVEKRGRSKAGWDVVLSPKGDGLALVSIAFPGDSQTLLVGSDAGGGSQNGAAASPRQ
jgi:Flagellin D3 domain